MAAIVDETGADVELGKGGFLVVKKPWPSMIRTIWGDPERFKKSYYPADFGGKYYLAGDGANRDLDGYFWIMGRIDDVLNVSGHRLGTMEIESALVAHPLVAEAAVVGRPDDLTGEAVCAFVVLKQARPSGAEAKKIADAARPCGQGDRRARQAEGHPLRRQPAEDALRQDHAPPAAFHRQGRGDHAGRHHAGESGHPAAAEGAGGLSGLLAVRKGRRRTPFFFALIVRAIIDSASERRDVP
jgi:acyl-CoA synthetase (AMP-forming)/AMP-acid ligase II